MTAGAAARGHAGSGRAAALGWVASAALLPFGTAAMQLWAPSPRRRLAWGAGIVVAMAAAEAATWHALDPNRHPGDGLSFALAQAALASIALQMLQGPAMAAIAWGRSRLRLAALVPLLATIPLAALPLQRVAHEVRLQAELADAPHTTFDEALAPEVAPGHELALRAIAEIRRGMDLGHAYPAAAETGPGRVSLVLAMADCIHGDAASCATQDALLGQVVPGTLDDPWTTLRWLAGLRPMRPAGEVTPGGDVR